MKKFLSALLALVMVLSMIPMAASAAYYYEEPCIEDSAIRDYYTVYSTSKELNYCVDENGNQDDNSSNLRPGYGTVNVTRANQTVQDYGAQRIWYRSGKYQINQYSDIKIENSNPNAVSVNANNTQGGNLWIEFNYVGEGTSEVFVTFTTSGAAEWNNTGVIGSQINLVKTCKLYYNVTSTYVPVDENNDGIDDLDGTCLHEKDDEGYCLVDGCIHNSEMGLTCCPKHESEPEIVPPAGPDANKLWETNYMGGIYVYMTCEKNSSHAAKIPVKGHDEGLIMGEVLPNDGSDSDFPVDEYPWMCHVAPDAEYFLEVAAEDYDINQVKRWNFNHTSTEVEGQTFYGDATGEYWFFSTSDGLYIDLTH